MLGGCGLVIAVVVFFAWQKSGQQWQRVIAWISAVWAGMSILVCEKMPPFLPNFG